MTCAGTIAIKSSRFLSNDHHNVEGQRQEEPSCQALSAKAFADRLRHKAVVHMWLISILSMLAFSAKYFDKSDEVGPRRVIDVFGDGPNNHGPPVLTARNDMIAGARD